MTRKRKRENADVDGTGSKICESESCGASSYHHHNNTPKEKMSSKLEQYPLSDKEREELEILFNKRITYNESNTLGLDVSKLKLQLKSCLDALDLESKKPDLVPQEPWQDQELMTLKIEMNTLKDQLSSKDIETWHNHTTECNIAHKIIPFVKTLDVELCTQAWVKFSEILNAFEIVPDCPFFSLHLCEAPGAFIASLNHFLQMRGFPHAWKWCATTLNPYHESNSLSEMIADDRLIKSSYPRWYFGPDGTGDIRAQGHVEGLVKKVKIRRNRNKVLLITADGSKDCQENPAEQEALVSQLHYCEALAACLILAPSGCLVIKLFTMYEASSIGLLCLLNVMFEQVSCIKPATSKSGNSESYVVCKGYHCNIEKEILYKMLAAVREKGVTCLFKKEDIPPQFLNEHRLICRQFAQWQSETICRNMSLYDQKPADFSQCLGRQQEAAIDWFAKMTGLGFNFSVKRIVPFSKEKSAFVVDNLHPNKSQGVLTKSHYQQWHGKTWKGTFHLRQNINNLSFKERIEIMDVQQASPPMSGLRCRYPVTEHEVQSWSNTERSASVPDLVSNSRLCECPVVDSCNYLIQNAQLSQWCQQQKDAHINAIADLLAKTVAVMTSSQNLNPSTSRPPPYGPCSPHRSSHFHHGNQHRHCDTNKHTQCGLASFPKNEKMVSSDSNQQLSSEKSRLQSDKIPFENSELSPVKATPLTQSFSPSPQKQTLSNSQNKLIWMKSCGHGNHLSLLNYFIEKQKSSVSNLEIKVEMEDSSVDLNSAPVIEDGIIYFQNFTEMFSESIEDSNLNTCEEVQSRYFCLERVTHILKRLAIGSHLILLTSTHLTRFHAGLLYLLARMFYSIRISSEPNVWRHQLVVCENFQGLACPSLPAFLFESLRCLEEEKTQTGGLGLLELIPFTHLLNDRKFVQFVTASNNYLLSGAINLILDHCRKGRKETDKNGVSITNK